MPRPSDDTQRQRVADLGTTFLVEAGAGTGKTTVLVKRFVACLLDDEGTTIDRVVAITFTEKAAGELRQRVRERVEQLVAQPADAELGELDEAQVERLRTALAGLEAAPISTIHSFASRMLRERPVEAGVDPAFKQLDALGSELLRVRLWEDWLASVLDEPGGNRRAGGNGSAGSTGAGSTAALLGEVLAADVRLTTVRSLAMALFAHRHDVAPAAPPAPPSLGGEVAAVQQAAANALAFGGHCRDNADKLLQGVEALATAVAELAAAGDPHELGAELARALANKKAFGGKSAGNKGNWGGAEGKQQMLDLRDAALARLTAAVDAYHAYVAALSLAVAQRFVDFAAERQRTLGALDFDDLLGMARDLLADLAVRGYFQQRFRYLLVDEFQDTDPLQAEIIFLLGQREPAAGPWQAVELLPGKLFLVGDPKQSIYRFRGADIGTYRGVCRLVAAAPRAEILTVSSNFRTVPSIIDWVNGAFASIIAGGGELQADYSPLDAARPRAGGEHSHVLAVSAARGVAAMPAVATVTAPEADDGWPAAAEGDSGEDTPAVSQAKQRVGQQRHDEAALIADLLADLAGQGWPVCERKQPGHPWREPRLGDVMVLFPSFTGVGVYERALRERGVPYRIEGGRTYFGRREVTDTIIALRAVDDASSALATYAALHSSLFGFSDDDLFAFHLEGGSFDYLADQSGLDIAAHPAVAGILAGLATLREAHEGREKRPLEETVDLVLRRTRFLEVQAAWGDGSEQAVGNLEKLAGLARLFGQEPQATFHGLVRYLGDAQTKADEAESPVGEDGDFVRLTTVHKAKGLEFSIVVLANAFSARQGLRKSDGVRTVLDRSRRPGREQPTLEFTLDSESVDSDGEYRSAGWQAAEEVEKEALGHEHRRLAYVACTRAADHLVVPALALPGAPDESLLGFLRGSLGEEAGQAVARRTWRPAALRAAATGAPLDAAALLRQRQAWRDERAALLRHAARPAPYTSPSRLERLTPSDGDEAGADDAEPAVFSSRDRALALGSAVHQTLERVALGDAAAVRHGGVLELLAAQAADESGCPDLAPRVRELAAACWRSRPVREAAESPTVYRELPVALADGDAIVEGYVDLLYQRGFGWVIVDYKTDRDADVSAAAARYELQLGAYALALEAAAGLLIDEAWVVMAAGAAPGGAAPAARIVIDDALRERARTAAFAVAEGVSLAGGE